MKKILHFAMILYIIIPLSKIHSETVFNIDGCNNVTSIAFSPDSQKFLTGHKNGSIMLWDVNTKKRLRIYNTDYRRSVRCLSFSSSGRKFISNGVYEKFIKLWSIDSEKCIEEYYKSSDSLLYLKFLSNDQSFVYLIRSTGDYSYEFGDLITLYDIKKNKKLITYKLNSYVCCVSPDEQSILSTPQNPPKNHIVQKDLYTGKTLKTYDLEGKYCFCLSFFQDGKRFLSGDGNKIKLFNVNNSKIKKNYKIHHNNISVKDISISPDGKTFVSVHHSDGSEIRLWDVNTGLTLRVFNKNTRVHKVLFSSDGKTVLCGGDEGMLINVFEVTKLFDEEIKNKFNKIKHSNSYDKYKQFVDKYQISVFEQHKQYVKYAVSSILNKLKTESLLNVAKCYSDFQNNLLITEEEKHIISSVLINRLLENNNLELYHEILQILPENSKCTVAVASNYVEAIYDQIIKPAKKLNPTIQFIDDFSESSGDIIQTAFTDAINLETETFMHKHDELVEKEIGWFKSLFDEPDHSTHVPEDSAESIVREKLARQIYIEAVQAKESGNNTLFLIKYRVVTRSPFFKQTEAAFNLHRDKEMRRFFHEQFKTIEDTQRQATSKLLDQLTIVNQSVNEMSSNIRQSIQNSSYEFGHNIDRLSDTIVSTNSGAEISNDEVYRQNHNFLMQSYFFNQSMSKYEHK